MNADLAMFMAGSPEDSGEDDDGDDDEISSPGVAAKGSEEEKY